MPKRRSPRKHTVHTKHPRYYVPQYQRGKGNPVYPSSSRPKTYLESYLYLDSDFKHPEFLDDIPETIWRYAYMRENAGQPHALKYIDLTECDSPVIEGYRQNPLYSLMRKGVKFEIKLIPIEKYFELCAKSRGRRGASAETERANVNDALAREYANKMLAGEKFRLPYVDFDYGNQEGRHRARALELLGVEKMPVMIIKPARKSDLPPKISKYTPMGNAFKCHPTPEFKTWLKDFGNKHSTRYEIVELNPTAIYLKNKKTDLVFSYPLVSPPINL